MNEAVCVFLEQRLDAAQAQVSLGCQPLPHAFWRAPLAQCILHSPPTCSRAAQRPCMPCRSVKGACLRHWARPRICRSARGACVRDGRPEIRTHMSRVRRVIPVPMHASTSGRARGVRVMYAVDVREARHFRCHWRCRRSAGSSPLGKGTRGAPRGSTASRNSLLAPEDHPWPAGATNMLTDRALQSRNGTHDRTLAGRALHRVALHARLQQLHRHRSELHTLVQRSKNASSPPSRRRTVRSRAWHVQADAYEAETGRRLCGSVRVAGSAAHVPATTLLAFTGRRFLNTLAAPLALPAPAAGERGGGALNATSAGQVPCASAPQDACAALAVLPRTEAPEAALLLRAMSGDAPRSLTPAAAAGLLATARYAMADALVAMLPAYLAPLYATGSPLCGREVRTPRPRRVWCIMGRCVQEQPD